MRHLPSFGYSAYRAADGYLDLLVTDDFGNAVRYNHEQHTVHFDSLDAGWEEYVPAVV